MISLRRLRFSMVNGQGEWILFTGGDLDCMFYAILQELAIRKIGKGVIQGQVFQLPDMLLLQVLPCLPLRYYPEMVFCKQAFGIVQDDVENDEQQTIEKHGITRYMTDAVVQFFKALRDVK